MSEKNSSAVESEQDKVDFLRARGVEVDLVRRKDTNAIAGHSAKVVDKTSEVKEEDVEDDGFLTEEQRQEWKRANESEDQVQDKVAKVNTHEVKGKESDDDDMTTAQREQWLRNRGVFFETPEDRAAQKNQQQSKVAEADMNKVSYVKIPWDTSKPLEQCVALVPRANSPLPSGTLPSQVDSLLPFLKPMFGSSGSDDVDMTLLTNQAQADQLLSSTDTTVSNDTLLKVAQEGHVETFSLLYPMKSNKYTQVQIYLDEVGLLKRLPLNSRASSLALRCGFNPPPKFYGDVYVGRLAHMPTIENADFVLGQDLPPDLRSSSLPEWIQKATMYNLEYQMERNKMQGIDTDEAARRQLQAHNVGEDGIAQEEDGGAYTWTQSDEEIELVVPSKTPNITTKDAKVSFHPKKVIITVKKEVLIIIDLFAAVDTDGCTWTLEKSKSSSKNLVISCEKLDGGLSWPRINT
jgi:hypothetical protein